MCIGPFLSNRIKPESSSNETCDEEAVFKMFPSLLFLFQLTLIYPVLHLNESLLMSSNRNVQGIGYSQLQRKLLETYPKMLKEPHNLLRSTDLRSVLTTTISDRRRKRREMLRRSNYNFDLSKEEILEILKNRSLNDWKISDLLHALKETFSSRRDLAINEDEDNHPEYLHHPQALVQEVELIMKKNISYVRVLENSL
ncbi:hypothetical protein Avbf_16794 [Armadillidium vulgare]|nr:hypothetical protein Avbf_16794 [Armadillidium vulgare]